MAAGSRFSRLPRSSSPTGSSSAAPSRPSSPSPNAPISSSWKKGTRRLTLLRDGRVLASYPVSLGFTPVGHKQREGDGRTPEGRYRVEYRNPTSVAHLSLKVSYPEAADRDAAAARGDEPGGDIMIHGVMNGLGWVGRLHRLMDWTSGCVGVSNAEMEAIYARVDVDTPIEIRP